MRIYCREHTTSSAYVHCFDYVACGISSSRVFITTAQMATLFFNSTHCSMCASLDPSIERETPGKYQRASIRHHKLQDAVVLIKFPTRQKMTMIRLNEGYLQTKPLKRNVTEEKTPEDNICYDKLTAALIVNYVVAINGSILHVDIHVTLAKETRTTSCSAKSNKNKTS